MQQMDKYLVALLLLLMDLQSVYAVHLTLPEQICRVYAILH